ncbi:unnamed protein product [Closterium sp. Yama58-4]|nr:unnamed protein product [Closterium sp. Yama58-4]
MALLEGVIAFDRSVASLPWTSREAVTDLFRAQLNGPPADAQLNGQPAEAQLSGQSADGAVSSGATEMTKSLERGGSQRDKNSGSTIDSPKEMNGVKAKDSCIGNVGKDGGMAGDNEAVVEYWSAQMAGLLEDLRSVRIGGAAEKTGGAKTKLLIAMSRKSNGTAIHTTCIEGVVHAPADAAPAMSCDTPFFKECREDAPPPLPGHMRMGISGGYAVKDMGEGRAHMRCIFTLDLKFPPTLVNFIIQQCGGIVYQWFTEELARIYDDPSSTKGKAFRQALHDEPLYNHVRAVMEKYRAARAAEQQQLEAEQQRKHQELVGGQKNGQAAGERLRLDSKEDEEKSFRELGAEVEAKIESLVASVSRRASSNGSIAGDGVEIVEAGEWG